MNLSFPKNPPVLLSILLALIVACSSSATATSSPASSSAPNVDGHAWVYYGAHGNTGGYHCAINGRKLGQPAYGCDAVAPGHFFPLARHLKRAPAV